MTFDCSLETAKHASWSPDETRVLISRFSLDFSDFVEECGDRDEYSGEVIFDWLGLD